MEASKFKCWLADKDIRENAVNLMCKIDRRRALDEDSLISVGVALCAIDRVLNSSNPDLADGKIKKTSMKYIWFKWTSKHHGFSNVILTKSEFNQFTSAVKEYLDKVKDEKTDGWIYSLPTIKYSVPAEPRPNEKVKSLSNDEKLQNQIFVKCAQRLWKKIMEVLDKKISEKLEKLSVIVPSAYDEKQSDDSGYNSNLQRLESQCLYELGLGQLKSWLEEDDDKRHLEEKVSQAERRKEAQTSHEQFVKMKDSLRIRMPEGIEEHVVSPPAMSFGREITSTRTRIKANPTTNTVELLAGSGLRYVHATGRGQQGMEGDLEKSKKQLIRKGLLAAENFDSEDPDSDFFKDKYHQYIEEHPILVESVDLKRKQKEDSDRAYQQWVEVKALRAKALRCLNHIPIPNACTAIESNLNNRSDDKIISRRYTDYCSTFKASLNSYNDLSSLIQMRLSAISVGSMTGLAVSQEIASLTPTQLQFCFKIGQALKRIDRTLYSDWLDWCNKTELCASLDATNSDTRISQNKLQLSKNDSCRLSPQVALAAWDYFEPRACDVHSAAYSQIRDTLLKLIKPGFDYQQTFTDYAIKMYQRKGNSLQLTQSVEDKKKVFSELSLSKPQFTQLLNQMGLVISQVEMSLVVDAFDTDGDGLITLQEFMSFIGCKRDRNSGVSTILSQKCIWLTTCKETGMANAFSISKPSKRLLSAMNESESKQSPSANCDSHRDYKAAQDDENHEYDEVADFNAQSIQHADMQIKTLKNGECRLCVEVKDRKNRVAILKKYELMTDGKISLRCSGNYAQCESKGTSDDCYNDEFEDYHDESTRHFQNDRNVTDTKDALTDTCAFVSWTMDKRRKGLDVLRKESKTKRLENQLQKIMKEGQPPAPPKVWIDVDSNCVEAVSTTSATGTLSQSKTSLCLRWSADSKKDIVSFFSIEFAGVADGTLRSERFKEVYRDPIDSNPDSKFKFSFIMRDLQYATSYSFRIRAYNGFGPSEYVYKTCTTICNKPVTPTVITATSTTVELRWVEDDDFEAHMIELKKFFTFADRDCNGSIDREELVLAMSDYKRTYIGSENITIFIKKCCSKLGIDANDSQCCHALFDVIEADDDGKLSWSEFQQFFYSMGWSEIDSDIISKLGNTNINGSNSASPRRIATSQSRSNTPRRLGTGPVVGSRANNSHVLESPGRHALSASSMEFTNTLRQASQSKLRHTPSAAITYVVEQCESEIESIYKVVLKTSQNWGVIARLEPGKSYRFRVHGVNADGHCGVVSDSIVCHTLLEQPAAPIYTAIKPTQLKIKWGSFKQRESSRNRKVVNKMLTDWAGLHSIFERDISIKTAFTKYDSDNNGFIDRAELANLLEDLNIPPSEDKLSDLFQEYDTNRDGVISLEEFAQWWRKEEAVYTVKRSEPILPLVIQKAMQLINPKFENESHINIARSASHCYNDDMKRDWQHFGTVQSGQFASEESKRKLHDEAKDYSDSDSDSRSHSDRECAQLSRVDDELLMHLERLGRQSVPDRKPVALSRDRGGSLTLTSTPKKPSKCSDFNSSTKLSLLKAAGESNNSNLVATPILCYRGTINKCDVLGLQPNHLYQIKVRHTGSRTHSLLSPPLEIMTAPLPLPNVPTLVTLSSTKLRIKWYPPKFGCYSFEIHMRKSLSNLCEDDNWVVAYNGQENMYVNTTMSPDSSYELRVYCINFLGIYSTPSPVLSFMTPARPPTQDVNINNSLFQNTNNMSTTRTFLDRDIVDSARLSSSSRMSDSLFHIVCTGDICVGDTILITERLYAKQVPNSITSRKFATASMNSSIVSEQIIKQNIKLKTSARGNKNGFSNTVIPISNCIHMESPDEAFSGNCGQIDTSRGSCIGERTFAANVIKDNYKTIREMKPSHLLLRRSSNCGITLIEQDANELTKSDCQQFSYDRVLWLEVIWQRTNAIAPLDSLKPFELKLGEIIQRKPCDLEQFEVYRKAWLRDNQRLHLWKEWTLLSECYLAYDEKLIKQ